MCDYLSTLPLVHLLVMQSELPDPDARHTQFKVATPMNCEIAALTVLNNTGINSPALQGPGLDTDTGIHFLPLRSRGTLRGWGRN